MNAIQHTDVVVLGGGAAGVAAAVAAARKGSKVILIERNAFPGGKATAAEVGTVCGLYKFSKKENSEYIVKGFAKEFADTLQKASGTVPLHNTEGLHYLPYDIEAFKSTCIHLLNEHKVEVYFNATLDKVNIEHDNIDVAFITAWGNSIELRLRSIVDCSGDSIISQAANLPLIKSEQYQAAAQVFTLQGIAEENEARLGMILMKALRSAIDEKKLADFYDRVYIVPGSLKNNCVSLKVGIPVAVTHNPGNMKELKDAAHLFITNLADFLINNIPVLKNAAIQHIAPEVGIRVGLRTTGSYTITEADVLSCRKFEDAIANVAWPIEEWEQHRRVKMRYFTMDDFYQVPAGCLQSNTIKNLFMAGRNISATDAAIASARVMGICLQTGYAAGYMAASAALQLSLKDAIRNIQNDQL
ncbi:MAG: FAD-dependent oxidoreductase [Ferruginibacter sp.]